jgi:hypothetical protein
MRKLSEEPPKVKAWQVGAISALVSGAITYFFMQKATKSKPVLIGATGAGALIGFFIGRAVTNKAQADAEKKRLAAYLATAQQLPQQQGALLGLTPQQMQQLGLTGQPGAAGAGLETAAGKIYAGANYTPNVYKILANQIYQAMDGWGVDAQKVVSVFGQIKNEADFLSLNEAFGVREGWTLEEWLKDQLAMNEINGINNGLYKKNIPYAY